MNRYIKIQYLKSGIPTGGTYVYKTSLDVQLGEMVMVTEKVKGIVVGFEVISNILQPERVKEIFGQIKKEATE
jgi:chorismate synthase